MQSRLWACLLMGALVLAAPRAARADEPSAADLATARALYVEGKELRAKGKVEKALEKLRAAHAIGHTPITGLELARTEMQLGHLVEAREACLQVARIPPAPDETERSAEARKDAGTLADELKPRIPSLLARVVGVAPGATVLVSIDDIELAPAAIGEPRKVNPGKHVVKARVAGGEAVTASVDIAEGETRQVELAPTRAKPASSSGLRTAGWITLGVGVVGLGLGSGFGILTLSKKSDADALCQGSQCTQEGLDLNAQAWTASVVSTVAFGVGAAAGVAGVVMILVGRAKPTQEHVAHVAPVFGPAYAGLEGRW